jgi:predicted RNase H-like HicB family nuclease
MSNQFTAMIETDAEWHIAYCPEIPGANGQGRSKEGCLQSLAEAIQLILEDRRQDSLRAVPPNALREVVTVEWSATRFSNTFGGMAATSSEMDARILCGATPGRARLRPSLDTSG